MDADYIQKLFTSRPLISIIQRLGRGCRTETANNAYRPTGKHYSADLSLQAASMAADGRQCSLNLRRTNLLCVLQNTPLWRVCM